MECRNNCNKQVYAKGLCRYCHNKKWQDENKERMKALTSSWYKKNREHAITRAKEYAKANPHIVKKCKDNTDKVKLCKYYKDRYANDVHYRLRRILRSRIKNALKQNNKTGSAVRDLGCSVEELKKYLESKFQPGMTWDVGGLWHVDHIVPLVNFDLSDPEQFKKACHYTNLQPLWAKDNLKKHDKLPRVIFVCGAPGAGKSWVCSQLTPYCSYVQFDKIKDADVEYVILAHASNNNVVLFDPTFKVSTYLKKLREMFDISLVVIQESEETIKQRIVSRGGSPNDSTITNRVRRMSVLAKKAVFSGTSAEVLAYLRSITAKSST